MDKKEDKKPTKKWINEQIEYHQRQIFFNQGSINLLEAMLKTGIYIEEPEKKNEEGKE